jgi:outer membrane protein
MKKTFAMAVLLFALSPAAIVTGQAQAVSGLTGSGLKVATISFNAAVLQTAEAQRQMAALETKYAPRETELKSLNSQVEEMKKNLEASGDKLTEAERASRQEALNSKARQLQRGEEDFRNDSQADSQQVFQAVAQKVFAFLQGYAKEHGYSMVVERGSQAEPVVWYAADNLDITNDVAKAYDAQAGAPAGAQKPQAPAKPATPSGTQPR